MCPSFQKFKTLLYESMDACKALDEIDCDAWAEFWQPCKNNLESNFGKSDFSTKEQCEFAIFNTCGGVGPFPGFRRLDCDKEVSSEAWDFYKTFSKNCKSTDFGMPTLAPVTPITKAPTTSSPVIQPTNPPNPQPTTPTQTPYTPSDATPTLKPYVPPDASPTVPYNPPPEPSPTPGPVANPTPYVPTDERSDTNEEKKSSHFFRNFFILCLLGGGGYYVYKKRFDSFNFVRYRRRGGYGYNAMYNQDEGMGYSGDQEMFGNLNSSTSFEPPSLPPTPAAMMGTEMT
jgi:hypothetical protein